MSDRLYQQLEEMEQQLSNLKGAIEALKHAEAASEKTVTVLGDTQKQLSDACSNFSTELQAHFSEFSQESKTILEDITKLLARLDKLDAAALAKLIDKNKDELGEQSKEQLDAQALQMSRTFDDHAIKMSKQFDQHVLQVDKSFDAFAAKVDEGIGSQIKELASKTEINLKSHTDLVVQALEKNASKELEAFETAMGDQAGILEANQEELKTRLRNESLELRESWRRYEDSTEKIFSDSVEVIRAAVMQNEREIKTAKTFSTVAAIAASVAFVASVVGIFI